MPAYDPEDGTMYEVLDLHHHVGLLDVVSVHAEPHEGAKDDPSLADMKVRLEIMDRFEMDTACIMPVSSWPRTTSAHALNQQISRYRDSNRARFPFALGVTDIKDVAAGLDELERLTNELHLDGVVWHHRLQGAFINHPFMLEALPFCGANGIPAFIHSLADSTMEAPWRVSELAERFPEVQIVVLDGFSSPSQAESMVQLGRRHSNLMFDTGVMTPVANQIDYFIDQNGDDRLMLGTDLYLFPHSYHFPSAMYEILNNPNLSRVSKEKILGGNARRLFGKGQPDIAPV